MVKISGCGREDADYDKGWRWVEEDLGDPKILSDSPFCFFPHKKCGERAEDGSSVVLCDDCLASHGLMW
jgi:hypothetical protein